MLYNMKEINLKINSPFNTTVLVRDNENLLTLDPYEQMVKK